MISLYRWCIRYKWWKKGWSNNNFRTVQTTLTLTRRSNSTPLAVGLTVSIGSSNQLESFLTGVGDFRCKGKKGSLPHTVFNIARISTGSSCAIRETTTFTRERNTYNKRWQRQKTENEQKTERQSKYCSPSFESLPLSSSFLILKFFFLGKNFMSTYKLPSVGNVHVKL